MSKDFSEAFIPDDSIRESTIKSIEEQANENKTKILSFLESNASSFDPVEVQNLAFSLAITNVPNSEMIHVTSKTFAAGTSYEEAIEKTDIRKSEELDSIRETYNSICSNLTEEQAISFTNFLDDLTQDHGIETNVKCSYRLPDELYEDLVRFQGEHPKRSDELLALSYLVMEDQKFIPAFSEELISSSQKDISLVKKNSSLIDPSIIEVIEFRENSKKQNRASNKALLTEMNQRLKSSEHYLAPDMEEMEARRPEMVMHPDGQKKPWNKYKKLLVQSRSFGSLPEDIQESLVKFHDTPIKLEHYEYIEEPLKLELKKEAMKELDVQYHKEKQEAIERAYEMVEKVGFSELPFEEKRAQVEFLNRKIEIYRSREPNQQDLEKFNNIANQLVEERLEYIKEESREAYSVERKAVREYQRGESQEFSQSSSSLTPQKAAIKKTADALKSSLSSDSRKIHFEAPAATKASKASSIER